MKTDKPTPKKSEWQFFVNAEGYINLQEKWVAFSERSDKSKLIKQVR